MKYFIISLIVLLPAPALCQPDIVINAVDNADGTVSIIMDVTGDAVVRGVALKVTCNEGALVLKRKKCRCI